MRIIKIIKVNHERTKKWIVMILGGILLYLYQTCSGKFSGFPVSENEWTYGQISFRRRLDWPLRSFWPTT